MTEMKRGNIMAIWESIGEGMSGDYNPDDPDDVEFLRFSVLEFHKTSEFGGQWEYMDDASYCTLMPVDTDERILALALEDILDAATSSWPKRRLEDLSWMKPEDYDGPRSQSSN